MKKLDPSTIKELIRIGTSLCIKSSSYSMLELSNIVLALKAFPTGGSLDIILDSELQTGELMRLASAPRLKFIIP